MPKLISHGSANISKSKHTSEITKVEEGQKLKQIVMKGKKHVLRDRSTEYQLIILNKRKWVKSVKVLARGDVM